MPAEPVNLEEVRAARAEHERLANVKLETGGGGGDSGGMGPRLEALEADVRDIKGILGRLEPMLKGMDDRGRKLETDLAELKGRVSQLPTTIQLLSFVLAVLALSGLLRVFG